MTPGPRGSGSIFATNLIMPTTTPTVRSSPVGPTSLACSALNDIDAQFAHLLEDDTPRPPKNVVAKHSILLAHLQSPPKTPPLSNDQQVDLVLLANAAISQQTTQVQETSHVNSDDEDKDENSDSDSSSSNQENRDPIDPSTDTCPTQQNNPSIGKSFLLIINFVLSVLMLLFLF